MALDSLPLNVIGNPVTFIVRSDFAAGSPL